MKCIKQKGCCVYGTRKHDERTYGVWRRILDSLHASRSTLRASTGDDRIARNEA